VMMITTMMMMKVKMITNSLLHFIEYARTRIAFRFEVHKTVGFPSLAFQSLIEISLFNHPLQSPGIKL
jgi:hypothetical protein